MDAPTFERLCRRLGIVGQVRRALAALLNHRDRTSGIASLSRKGLLRVVRDEDRAWRRPYRGCEETLAAEIGALAGLRSSDGEPLVLRVIRPGVGGHFLYDLGPFINCVAVDREQFEDEHPVQEHVFGHNQASMRRRGLGVGVYSD